MSQRSNKVQKWNKNNNFLRVLYVVDKNFISHIGRLNSCDSRLNSLESYKFETNEHRTTVTGCSSDCSARFSVAGCWLSLAVELLFVVSEAELLSETKNIKNGYLISYSSSELKMFAVPVLHEHLCLI